MTISIPVTDFCIPDSVTLGIQSSRPEEVNSKSIVV